MGSGALNSTGIIRYIGDEMADPDCSKQLSIADYTQLMRRDRRVYSIEEMTLEQLKALENAEVAPEYAHLDEELKGWKP
jgi:hypothetical protein